MPSSLRHFVTSNTTEPIYCHEEPIHGESTAGHTATPHGRNGMIGYGGSPRSHSHHNNRLRDPLIDHAPFFSCHETRLPVSEPATPTSPMSSRIDYGQDTNYGVFEGHAHPSRNSSSSSSRTSRHSSRNTNPRHRSERGDHRSGAAGIHPLCFPIILPPEVKTEQQQQQQGVKVGEQKKNESVSPDVKCTLLPRLPVSSQELTVVDVTPTTATTTTTTMGNSFQKIDSTDALIAAGGDASTIVEESSAGSITAREEEPCIERPALPQAPYGWPALSDFPKWYWKRLTGFDQSLNAYTLFEARWDVWIGFLFCAASLLVLGFLEHFIFVPMVKGPMVIFIPAMSATATCLFTVPKLPVSQPRTILIGHVSAGVIGVSLMNLFLQMPQQPYGVQLAGAIGLGIHQIFMICTNTLHPPSSATVISAVSAYYDSFYNDKGFIFCVTPCITGSLVLIIMSILLNNLVPWRSPYPQYW